ncbi:MFS transporter [Comamonas sediminis]|uniref:MFS transporter n=1 Tax=Comamonas TaxID=283 RepID=UPI0028996123|nr:MFS transporter [Comamonas sp.]
MAEAGMQPASLNQGLPMPERRLAMLVIVLGLIVAVLDGSIMNLALPTVAKELQASPAEAIWIINAYQLGTLGLLLPLAALGERIGYRKVYLVGLVCFTLASAVAMLAQSLWLLIAARGLQGMGAAGVMAVNAALVRLTYPAAKLGKGMALNSLVVAISSVAGPGVAALILSVASWPWLFAINVPLGILTLWLGRKALPRNPQQLLDAPHAKLTPIDVVLNFAMFSLVFLGAERIGARHDVQSGGSAASGWLMLGLGLLLGAWYVLRQRKLSLPLLPLDLLRIPVFALSMGASIGAFAAQMLSFIALPFLLLDALQRSHFAAGMLMTAWSVAIVVVAPLAGRLIGRVQDGLLGGIGMAILALGLLSLALLPVDPSDLNIGWRMALCGLGFGLFQSPNNHTIVTSAPLARAGAASGMLGTARLTGQSLGAVLVAIIFTLWPVASGHGTTVALYLAAGFAAMSGVFSSLRLRHSAH